MNRPLDIPARSEKAPASSGLGAAPSGAPAPAPRRRLLLQVLLALLLLAAGFAGWKTIMALAPQPKVRAAHTPPLPVRVLTVRLRDVRPAWTFYGEVMARRVSSLQLPVSGRIVWVSRSWRDGALVKKGAELLRIDDVAYRAAVAEAEAALAEADSSLAEARLKVASEERLLKDAEAQLEVARRELERTRRLVRRGTLPSARLDEQQRAWLAAREKLEQRRHALAAARAALTRQQAVRARAEWKLKKAREDLRNTVLRAPFDGQLNNPRAEVGQQAGPSATLAELISTAAPEVRFTMPETRLAALKRAGEQATGRKVSVMIMGGRAAAPARLPAIVTREGAQVDRKQGAISLFARLEDAAAARWLKPGMFAEVRMNGPLMKNVALLPEAALHDGNTVYAVRDGRLIRHTVRVLGVHQGQVIVSGLPPGARVVRHHLAEPAPGRAVRLLDEAGQG